MLVPGGRLFARLAAVCALFSLSVAGAGTAHAQDEPPPPPVKPPSAASRWGLVIGGGIALTFAHITPLAIAARYDFRDAGGWFAAPIIGPWGYLAARPGCKSGDDQFTGAVCSFGNTMLVIVVVADGLLQIGGAAMLVAGLVSATRKKAPAEAGKLVRPTVIALPGGGLAAGVQGSW